LRRSIAVLRPREPERFLDTPRDWGLENCSGSFVERPRRCDCTSAQESRPLTPHIMAAELPDRERRLFTGYTGFRADDFTELCRKRLIHRRNLIRAASGSFASSSPTSDHLRPSRTSVSIRLTSACPASSRCWLRALKYI